MVFTKDFTLSIEFKEILTVFMMRFPPKLLSRIPRDIVRDGVGKVKEHGGKNEKGSIA
ncbi:hypothetical protein KGMB01110_27290 [Mediterraneibacter butyricigenes]|uniref:Uncharacterized protein n=1 Tax=Mediterraneibacter butyricigenes TaxID=2316025 RepID=A0A391PF23_9FIRM|nr:hypothetical protein KGMB01110_27290 [Mediterraneibacter butyricigenes]